jgi:hypothetical protein
MQLATIKSFIKFHMQLYVKQQKYIVNRNVYIIVKFY